MMMDHSAEARRLAREAATTLLAGYQEVEPDRAQCTDRDRQALDAGGVPAMIDRRIADVAAAIEAAIVTARLGDRRWL